MLFTANVLAAPPIAGGLVLSGGYPDLFAATGQLDIGQVSLEVGYANLLYIHTLVGRSSYFVPIGNSVVQVGPTVTVRNFYDFESYYYGDDRNWYAVYAGASARVVSRGPGVVHFEVVATVGGGLVFEPYGPWFMADGRLGVGLLFGHI